MTWRSTDLPGSCVAHRGIEGQAVADSRQELLELTEAGDHVLAMVRWTVRGQSSDVEVTFDLFEDYEFREGKVSRMRFFLEREKALEAAGLSG